MLVITRKTQETIRIGDNVSVTVVRVGPNSVRIGIDAPRRTRILRGELAGHGDNFQPAPRGLLGNIAAIPFYARPSL